MAKVFTVLYDRFAPKITKSQMQICSFGKWNLIEIWKKNSERLGPWTQILKSDEKKTLICFFSLVFRFPTDDPVRFRLFPEISRVAKWRSRSGRWPIDDHDVPIDHSYSLEKKGLFQNEYCSRAFFNIFLLRGS